MKILYSLLVLCAVIRLSAQNEPEWNDFCKWKGQGDAKLELKNDTLTILRDGGSGYSQAVAPSVFLKERKMRQLLLSAELSCRDAVGVLVLTGYGADRKVKLWKIASEFKGSSDWKKVNCPILIPEEIRSLSLACRITSPAGAVSVRRLSAAWCGMECLNPGLELLKTSWLGTKNGKLPANWSVKFWPANEATFEVLPSAGGVNLVYRAGGARFGIKPELALSSVPAGTVLRFKAKYRTSGSGSAALMAEFHDRNGKMLGEELSPSAASGKWDEIGYDFIVPAGTGKMDFSLLNTGKGTVSYLNATLKVIPHSENKPQYPVSVFASPLEGNRIIHGGRNVFHTIADSPASLSFDFWGDRKIAADTAFVIEVEDGLQVAGCYSSHPEVYRNEIPDVVKVRRGGRTFYRYRYRSPAAFRLIEPSRRWCRQVVAAFEPDCQTGEKREFDAYFYLDGPAGKSAEKAFTVKVLPPLEKLANPKSFRFYAWSDHDLNFPEKTLFRKAARKYEEAGLKSRQRSGTRPLQELDDILERRGWNMHIPLQDYTRRQIVGKIVDSLPDKRYAVERSGQVSTHNICPEYYTDSPLFRRELEKLLLNYLRKNRAKSGDWVFMDYEPWAAMNSCFCKFCLEKFYGTLTDGAKPAPEEINKKYRREWAAYRSEQTARVNRLTARLIRQYDPGLFIADYDYPVPFDKPDSEAMFMNICKDPRLYEDCIDAHFLSFYHHHKKAAFELIDVNAGRLKKPVFITPAISRNDIFQGSYTTDEETLAPRQFRQMVLAGATAGIHGVCIFPGYQLDGAFFPAINRASYEIALFEEMFLKGKRREKDWSLKCLPNRVYRLKDGVMEQPRWSDFSGFRVHEYRNETLFSLFNFNSREVLYASLNANKMLPGKNALYDPVGKRRFVKGAQKLFEHSEIKELMFKIAPEDVLFLKMVPEDGLPQGLSECDLAEMEREYRKMLDSGSGEGFKGARLNGSEAVMSVFDGRPGITVRTPLQTVVVSLCGGIICQWNVGGIPFSSSAPGMQYGGLLRDRFLVPFTKHAVSDADYTLDEVTTTSDSFLITLRYQFAAKGISLRKRIEVPLKKAEIRTEWRISNIGREVCDISFWSHNFPAPGNPADPLHQLEFRLGKTAIELQPAEQVFICRNNMPVKFKNVIGRTDSGEVAVRNMKTGHRMKFSIPAEQANQFYFWRGANVTVESMTIPVKLQPGQVYRTSALWKAYIN